MSAMPTFKGKKVLVFGLGMQGGGLGDAIYLHQQGADVCVTDQKSAIELESTLQELPTEIKQSLGGHKEEDIDWAELVIKNPGVPDDHPLILRAHNKGIPVRTSIALVIEAGRDKVVGVTGTRGKSTTTELIFKLLLSAYPGQVEKGGNIPGTSGLSLLQCLPSLKYLVLELSSFQLHDLHSLKVSPGIAVITNMYPDHLNRYSHMTDYLADKAAIVRYQNAQDLCLYNADNEYATELGRLSQARRIAYQASELPAWDYQLPGTHNRENLAAVYALSRELALPLELVKNVLTTFHGLAFRLERRGTVRGVTYINDTTSTTPTSTIKAIESLAVPTVMIIGGADKGLPIDSLVTRLSQSSLVKGIVLLGSQQIPHFTKAIEDRCQDKLLGRVDSMKEAVTLATQHATTGEQVLLSPGFSSFDLFDNEFDRGRQFNECVSNLSA